MRLHGLYGCNPFALSRLMVYFVTRINQCRTVMCKSLLFSFSTLGVFVLTFVYSATAHAQNASKTATAELVTSGEKGSELQLEVRQMPLDKVLDTLVKKTNVPIHYSVLPDGFITATCVGASLKPVLECLLNHKADIIVRYSRDKSGSANSNGIAEAWILGSKLEASAGLQACAAPSDKGSLSLINKEQETGPKSDQTGELLKIAKSENANERAEAIGALLAIGSKGGPEIKAMLEEAVHDQDAYVRAQAVSTLTHIDEYKDGTAEIIQEALHDNSVDVRMMAVDGTDDVVLLQQASNDSDETVRSLAEFKLQQLTQSNDTAQ